MADFREAGKPKTPGFRKITFHVDQKVKVDFWGDKDVDVTLAWVAYFGTSADWKEVSSPMPKVIRRFELVGRSPGTGILVALPNPGLAAINLGLFNRVAFPVIYAELEVEVDLSADQAFIVRLEREGRKVAEEFKLPISIMIAHACLESTFGRSGHAVSKNALYGITKLENLPNDWYPACNKIASGSTEAVAGKGNVTDRFCRADHYPEAVRIWAEYVTRHPNSGPIKPLLTGGPWSRADLEKFAAYFPTVNFGKGVPAAKYKSDLMSIIDQHHLTRFDP